MLKLENIHKRFGDHEVLKGVSLDIAKGEFVAVIGASGCGKTTLIRCINGFVVPEEGSILFEEKPIEWHNPKKMREVRRRIGMIYQLFNLVERVSAQRNVLCGALGRLDSRMRFVKSLIGFFGKDNLRKADDIMGYVGIENRRDCRADKLSGGQKQRVAIARALMQEPHLLLADEPIANLDPKTSTTIIELLRKINLEKQLTIVTVIHHIDFVKDHFSRVIAIKDGMMVFDGNPSELNKKMLDELYSGEKDGGEDVCAVA